MVLQDDDAAFRGGPLCTKCWALWSDNPGLTYLGSFLEQGDHHRRVSAAHRPVERTHPAVVYMLYHGPVVNQELDLRGQRNVLTTVAELLNNNHCEKRAHPSCSGAESKTCKL